MSSYKIIRGTTDFTPVTLIQEEINPEELIDVLPEPPPDSPPKPARDLPETAAPAPGPAPDPVQEPRSPVPSGKPAEVDLEAAKLEAYQQGVHDAETRLGEAVTQAGTALQEAARKLDGFLQQLQDRSRGDLINLVISLTRKIVDRELTTGRDIIAATLEESLNQAMESREYVVSLHPADLEMAQKIAPELIERIRGLENLEFRPDPKISRGGCLLDSTVCSVDATMETQMDSVREFLQEHLNDASQKP